MPHWSAGREIFGRAVTELFYETNPGKGEDRYRSGRQQPVAGRGGMGAPHRPRVEWKGSFNRDDMSPALATSTKAVGTVSQLTSYAAELASLAQLEDFLVHNWANTSLGREFDIYADGEQAGRQYLTDPRPLTSWRSAGPAAPS